MVLFCADALLADLQSTTTHIANYQHQVSPPIAASTPAPQPPPPQQPLPAPPSPPHTSLQHTQVGNATYAAVSPRSNPSKPPPPPPPSASEQSSRESTPPPIPPHPPKEALEHLEDSTHQQVEVLDVSDSKHDRQVVAFYIF